MPGADELPIYTKIEHKSDSAASARFVADLDSILNAGQQRLSRFSDQARATLDNAISIPRNSAGALDVDVPQLKAAADAMMARATAAREVANATVMAAREEGKFSQETRLAISAAKALATEEERAAASALAHARAAEQVQAVLNRQTSATDMVVEATRRGTRENGNVINSVRAQRRAFTQFGQQLTDIGVQLQGGQSPFTILVQQVPQAGFALSGLQGSSNKAYSALGALGAFISGPWGGMLAIGIALLGPFIGKLFETEKSVDDLVAKMREDFQETLRSKQAHEAFNNTLEGQIALQQKLTEELDRSIKSQRQLNEEKLRAAQTNAGDLRAQEASLVTQLENARKQRADAFKLVQAPPAGTDAQGAFALQQNYAAADALVGRLQNQLIGVSASALAAERNIRAALVPIARDEAKAAADPIAAVNRQFDIMAENATSAALANDALAQSLGKTLSGIEKQREAALKAERDTTRSASRETATFIDPVSGPITSGFGPRARPTAGASSNHPAIDFGVPVGTAVRAPQVGTVTAIGFDKGLGKYVVIDHGAGTTTRFAHLSDNSIVREGQRVEQGDIIAKSGNTGTSTGPHLDYQVKVNGRPVDPRKRSFPIDAVKTAEAAEKAGRAAAQAEQQLKDFGTSASASIEQINARFDDQPRLIDQATVATTKLNAIISELGDKQPPGFEKLIADAEKAKDTIQDALVRPIQDMAKESQRGLQIQELVLSGREREASVLQRIWEAQRILGDDLQGQEQQVRAIAEAEYDRLEVIKRQTELQSAYLDATRSVRQEVEAILSGQGKFSNFKAIFRDLQGKVLTEQIFGDVFRDLDTWVKRNTGVGRATDEFTRATDKAGSALEDLAKRVDAIGSTAGTGMSGASAIGAADSGAAIDALLSGRSVGWHGGLNPPGTLSAAGAANDNFDPNADIVVIANKGARLPIDAPKGTLMAMSPKDYVDGVSAALGARFLDALNATFGTSFFSRFQGVLSGAAGGYVSGGVPGGIIGAIGSIKGLPKELSKTLGKAGEGAATGTAAAGIMKALGIKTSTTGAQIGGAIGSAIPIPGGDIIGSIIGGLVGGLFKKTKYGSATIGSVNGVLGVTGTTGNSGQYIKAAGENADSILAGIDRIAQALGATVNASAGAVSIGYYKGKVRVDPTGAGRTKSQVDFGKDGLAAAIQYATLDLIKDGVLTGLRQGTQTLLKNAKDLDTGLQKAVDFEGVFAQLKAIKDPVGAALDGLDKEFVRLKGVFTEAGANAEELASLEELYGLKRVEAVKQANEQIIGSMKSLLSDLKTGDNGLSLKDREAAARAAYDPLAARVRAGDVTAAEDFTAAARTLLDIERQIYGSQQPYFNVFNEIKTLSQTMVDTQEAIATASANRDSPFSKTTSAGTDNASVVNAIDSQTNALVSELKAANDNLISILQKLSASGVNLAGGIAFNGSF